MKRSTGIIAALAALFVALIASMASAQAATGYFDQSVLTSGTPDQVTVQYEALADRVMYEAGKETANWYNFGPDNKPLRANTGANPYVLSESALMIYAFDPVNGSVFNAAFEMGKSDYLATNPGNIGQNTYIARTACYGGLTVNKFELETNRTITQTDQDKIDTNLAGAGIGFDIVGSAYNVGLHGGNCDQAFLTP